MQRSAETLGRMGLEVDRILTSPLTRALQTAEIVAKRLGAPLLPDERLAEGFGTDALEELLAPLSPGARVMLVGHEPSFSLTIGAVVGGARIVCKKGTLARVDLHSSRPLRGELVWLIPPRALAPKGGSA
jgi:phosphohistidine phosphatase